MGEFEKTMNDYVTIQNKKTFFYLIKCEFILELDNNFTANIETIYFYTIDITKIKRYLLYDIYYFTSRDYKVCNINQKTIKTISGICNMTYEQYMNQPLFFLDLRLNMVVAKNPQL